MGAAQQQANAHKEKCRQRGQRHDGTLWIITEERLRSREISGFQIRIVEYQVM
jgi:hypothetical protein